jgi:hypothetical protein
VQLERAVPAWCTSAILSSVPQAKLVLSWTRTGKRQKSRARLWVERIYADYRQALIEGGVDGIASLPRRSPMPDCDCAAQAGVRPV